jgi:hypothetical protein
MKLVVIWLFGVPLAIGAMCAAAILWPRVTVAQRHAAVAPPAAIEQSARQPNADPHHVIAAIRQ